MAATTTRRHWLGGLGVLLATLALATATGPWGLAAGIAIALAWYRLPASFAFAVGQLLALPSLGPTTPLQSIVAVEVGLFALLAGPLAATDAPGRTVVAFVVATLTIGAVGWAGLRGGWPLWLVAVAIAIVAATAGYGVHRYERVRLGLVEEVV